MEAKNIILAISIIVAGFIIGYFVYLGQINKQESIERQQEMIIKQQELKEQLEREKEKEETAFNNNLKCQDLLPQLRRRWNNVVGIYYDKYRNNCMVKYTEYGRVKESALEDMQDVN